VIERMKKTMQVKKQVLSELGGKSKMLQTKVQPRGAY
jgi:hypothetical protein